MFGKLYQFSNLAKKFYRLSNNIKWLSFAGMWTVPICGTGIITQGLYRYEFVPVHRTNICTGRPVLHFDPVHIVPAQNEVPVDRDKFVPVQILVRCTGTLFLQNSSTFYSSDPTNSTISTITPFNNSARGLENPTGSNRQLNCSVFKISSGDQWFMLRTKRLDDKRQQSKRCNRLAGIQNIDSKFELWSFWWAVFVGIVEKCDCRNRESILRR